ncbi:MAG: hypothetical protein R3352_10565, partial [Salinisphaeraceae bacterium]|nr:hypothetical protein [Salinisphaeraceae bacterium]
VHRSNARFDLQKLQWMNAETIRRLPRDRWLELARQALTKGGIQRLYTGNLASGRHVMEATITGYDPLGKDYQKTTSYTFTKGAGKKMVEMQVVDDLNKQQHKFEFREWNQQ